MPEPGDHEDEAVGIAMKTVNDWFPRLSATEDGAIDVEDRATEIIGSAWEWLEYVAIDSDATGDGGSRSPGAREPVVISEDDFSLLYDTFDKLMWPWPSREALVGSIRREDVTWALLQRIAVERRGVR